MLIASAFQDWTNCFFLQLNLKGPDPGNSALASLAVGAEVGRLGGSRALKPLPPTSPDTNTYTGGRSPVFFEFLEIPLEPLGPQPLEFRKPSGSVMVREAPGAVQSRRAKQVLETTAPDPSKHRFTR